LVPDAAETIQALQALDKEVFIVSGGLLAAVRPFGEWLGIPHHNIRAVDVHYNQLSGHWWDFQQDRWGQRPDVEYMDPEETPLIESHGKTDVIRELLKGRNGQSMLVGDGMSDLAARPAINLMVGFGGVVTRQGVLNGADIFITANSLAPVVPLALSKNERLSLLGTTYETILNKGLKMIEAENVIFRSSQ
jgi:phosphoserine phosphatase